MQHNTDAVVLLTTVSNADQAQTLAQALIESKLAACVSLLPAITSYYHWDGALQKDTEQQLIIKTISSKLETLEQWMNTHHPYDVPELLALDIKAGSNDYLNWLKTTLNDEK
ncbi:divalent-cation tolerance protein CutA [Pleionea sp. CnH1-48]|uniref:divalent-cation tolerance protein CutA n=1 Tax=Pleionea sp. CnH1-48 TaxID=2954494 RepID=UPI002097D90C|nr:divalent-cation tolerance protein CutA [Pleionea sp. CnH1-48]MCO7224654.1 divalent-cation tolerance protein CutA [Pleionea sp. CnH1-48]